MGFNFSIYEYCIHCCISQFVFAACGLADRYSACYSFIFLGRRYLLLCRPSLSIECQSALSFSRASAYSHCCFYCRGIAYIQVRCADNTYGGSTIF